MLREKELSKTAAIASHQYTRERDYWLNKLSGEITPTVFPYDRQPVNKKDPAAPQPGKVITAKEFKLPAAQEARLIKLSGGYDYSLHMILAAAVMTLLHRYTGKTDIIIGMPIYRQDTGDTFVNTLLALRNRVEDGMTFKELLVQVKQTVIQAEEHQNYAMETLLHQLNMPYTPDNFPLFDVAVILENVHDKSFIQHIQLNVVFSFHRRENSITGTLEYNPALYREETAAGIIKHYTNMLAQFLENVGLKAAAVDMLAAEEREQLLYEFNETRKPYPGDKTISELFEEQVEKHPDRIALTGENPEPGTRNPEQKGIRGYAPLPEIVSITYRELNQRANRLAGYIRKKGVKPGDLVGLLQERTIYMIEAVWGVIKAGGVYLPTAPETPVNRIGQILEDARVSILLSHSAAIGAHAFTHLQKLRVTRTKPYKTAPRAPITDLDTLPWPDRSSIDNNRYAGHIGLAMVKNCITLQGTRGCPYSCAYCARLWPKKQVVRSAENLFAEVKHYYDLGIRRFSIIDDIFNLDIKNSLRFYQLIIDNRLDLQLLFPAGLRGDIMDRDYIDCMVEAGTINISVALETASPRLQKLIRKNLNIDKLYENLQYICDKHPGVILDLFTMHGLPTETREEAMMTLEFIKSLKWLHFPLINITRIYPDTALEQLALASGITRESILKAENLAWHEAADTLPFDKSFTTQYQAEFLDNYFLKKERLLHVLPNQMKVLTEDEIAAKYNSYLPTEKDIKSLDDLLDLVGIGKDEPQLAGVVCEMEEHFAVPDMNRAIRGAHPAPEPAKDALRVLLLDLSQSYTRDKQLLDELYEPPLGLMYLLTYLKQQLGTGISGKIAKSGIDFDNDEALKELLAGFKPQVIGIRTLTFYKDFFHRTAAKIRQWGYDIPVIAGGPYATNGYDALLQDRNIDLVVLAEGEITFLEIIKAIKKNRGQLPPEQTLEKIPGIVYIPGGHEAKAQLAWDILMIDEIAGLLAKEPAGNVKRLNNPRDPVYTIYTSGSTGNPRGVVVRHQNLHNLVTGLNHRIYKNYPRPMKVAMVSPYIFDASVKQIFAALLLGHLLCIVPEETRVDGYQLLEYFIKHGVEVTDGTPTHIKLLLETHQEGTGRLCLKHLLIGGEPLYKSTVKEFFRWNPGNPPRVTNVYGPSECTVDAAAYNITADNINRCQTENIPIGTPLANTGIFIVVPGNSHQHQPVGVPGELCISGDSVSAGYLNNPELTAQKFDLNNQKFLRGGPGGAVFSKSAPPGRRRQNIYRTGDWAKWQADGSIQFLGRIDRQVKIRGYRLEPGEIESQLLKHQKVKQAVVVVKQARSGDQHLCAYIVPELTGSEHEPVLDTGLMRRYLSLYLPDYMVPTYFVAVEKIPLTANGKIDREALPEPGIGSTGVGYRASRDAVEGQLVQIWSDLLKIDPGCIGIDNDFFQVGGHSLKATILITKIHKVFHTRVPLQEIFKTPTIKGIADYIKKSGKDIFYSIKPVEKREYYRLSSAQNRLYASQQMDLNATNYNSLLPVLLEGEPDLRRLQEVFRALTRRHESLRTSFEIINGQPGQMIRESVNVVMAQYRMTGEQTMEFIRESFEKPFNLAGVPLFRVAVIKVAQGRHIMVLHLHHIISDGTSMGILMKEFMQLYEGESLPPLRIRYVDYCQWQGGKGQKQWVKKQEQYWQGQFETGFPVLNLPTDFPRSSLPSFAGGSTRFRIDSQKTREIKKLTSQEDLTMYMLMLAVFNVFLFKITGQEDILVGTPVANRQHVDLQFIVGMLVNMLVMRNFPKKNQTFRSFLKEVKKRTLQAFENQDYKLEDLMDRVIKEKDPGRHSLFDVSFSWQNMEIPKIEISGLRMSSMDYTIKSTRFDLVFVAHEHEETKQINVIVEYSSGLFKEETIRMFIKNFNEVIEAVLEDVDILLKDIEISTVDVAQAPANLPHPDQLDLGF